MLRAETFAGAPAPAPPGVSTSLSGWGGGERVPVTVLSPADEHALRAGLLARGDRGAVPRGMGRSYGDAAQLRDGLVLETRRLRAFTLDQELGVLETQAGVTLGALLAALEPAGWLLPVVPGTQHVSVGGAIACDIHGKNHGAFGTFGAHVLALGLIGGSGELRELSPDQDGELFAATIGGMGLTGAIVGARIRVRRLPSPVLAVDTDRVTTLDDALALLDGPGGPHRVAWLDLLGRRPVRGVVTRASELVAGAPGSTTVASRARVPPRFPAGLLRPELVRAHNALRFAAAPRRRRAHPEPFGAHMFPLDVLDAWPRLYGPAGLCQYQLVVPRGREQVLERVIERLRGSRVPCYLAVLKDFGPANTAPLSFPLEGWTLALDLPRAAAGLEALLESLDQLVAAAGGRVYLAKDARLRPETVAAMYPRLAEWREVRDRADPDGVWRSDLGLRTGLVRAR
jgi:decaprenylphospho-beta-D-ribofuranose 2-oxidase